MIHLECRDHVGQVREALQNNLDGEVMLIGNDNVSTDSDTLWVFSPFIRSILGSMRSIEDNFLILPDFSNEDIKAALGILEENNADTFIFSSTTKVLLETLGVDLQNVQTVDNRENTNDEELLDSTDGEEDLQSELMAENIEFDSSDDEQEETEPNDIISNEENAPNDHDREVDDDDDEDDEDEEDDDDDDG